MNSRVVIVDWKVTLPKERLQQKSRGRMMGFKFSGKEEDETEERNVSEVKSKCFVCCQREGKREMTLLPLTSLSGEEVVLNEDWRCGRWSKMMK